MTEPNKTPEPTPAETPTTPLPITPEAAPTPDATAPSDTAPPAYAQQPPVGHHHGVHVAHKVSEGAIAAMVIGSILFAAIAFGVGWHARGAAARFQAAHYGVTTQGYGNSQLGVPGHPPIGRRGMMRGGAQGFGKGSGLKGGGVCPGQSQSQGQGSGWRVAPGQAAPDTGTPY